MDPSDVDGDLAEILITREAIDARLREIAAQIDVDYAGRDLLLVGVLKGAVMVMADLSRLLATPVALDWMAISSYGSGASSSGIVRILKDLDSEISGRDVLVVEDIIDSGLTLEWLIRTLGKRGAASLRVMTLLRKPESVRNEIEVHYLGFDIPDDFVVGYGLDFDERFRNLNCIARLAPHVYEGS